MYQIQYNYNHGTWIEARCSNWLKNEEDVIKQLDIIKSYNAIDICIVQLVNVTKKFNF